jgi:hypothetical protein
MLDGLNLGHLSAIPFTAAACDEDRAGARAGASWASRLANTRSVLPAWRNAKAKALYRPCACHFGKRLWAQHPNLVKCLENCASLLRKMDRPDEAEPLDGVERGATAGSSMRTHPTKRNWNSLRFQPLSWSSSYQLEATAQSNTGIPPTAACRRRPRL